MSSSEKNGSEPESLSSVLADTQKCDGPCKKLFNVSKLKVYDCGHVICGNCFTEMPLRGVAEADGRCLLGECRRKFENSRRQQPRRQASIHRYLSDAVSALRRTKYAHLVQPPKPSRGDERHSGSLEESNGCEECRARAECQCCCSDCSDQVTLVSNPKVRFLEGFGGFFGENFLFFV
uniref:RING-type domain-containing protein n=1 Tax=Bursaphelenchus xylophilus TaxID=6326 RepID=A0A1I7SBA5_BURXY